MAKKPTGRLAQVTGRVGEITVDAAAHYDEWASTYDDELRNEYGYIAPRIVAENLARLVPAKTAVIADMGCGTGLVGEELAACGYSCFDGLDFSAGMLAKAKAKGLYRRLYEGSLLARTALADSAYDAVVSAGTFGSHVGPEGIAELIRVAKPGAPIVVYMNAQTFEELDFQGHLEDLQEQGLWRLQHVIGSNYMDEIERAGNLIIGVRTP